MPACEHFLPTVLKNPQVAALCYKPLSDAQRVPTLPRNAQVLDIPATDLFRAMVINNVMILAGQSLQQFQIEVEH